MSKPLLAHREELPDVQARPAWAREKRIIESMFDDWLNDPDYPTLYRVDRDVVVDVSGAFPGISSRRQDELPLWVKACALRLEPSMRARQVAWIRRASDGGWMAVVLMPATSANGKSRVTMQLWLEPDVISTDLTTGT
jgi:hypothetical protein